MAYYQIIFLVPILLFVQVVNAQVEIHQSQTTSINGQTSSITSDNGKQTIKTTHGTITIDGDKIKYCAKKCLTYTLEDNGSITK